MRTESRPRSRTAPRGGASPTKPAEDRVLTRHPAGKNGVRIARDKYEAMRRAILRSVPRSVDGVAFQELPARVREVLGPGVFGPSDGLTWYLVAVKQDLEARGELEQVPRSRPQRLRRPRAVSR